MTVRDALTHNAMTDLRRAADALAATLPVGRTVKITQEAIDAAAAGDVALLATLFAQAVEPDEADLAALQEAEVEDDGSRLLIGEVRKELGLTP